VISVIVISKDEPFIGDTLSDLAAQEVDESFEVLVVDASSGRLEVIRHRFPDVTWLDYRGSGNVTIAAQRNLGMRAAKGEVVTFTDAGCRLPESWLATLTAPIRTGVEQATAGETWGAGPWSSLYQPATRPTGSYLKEAPTINLALSRRVIDEVGQFDERFTYGSDIDYTWRVVAAGFRLLLVPEARIVSDWGNRRRQIKRSFSYGQARVHLHRKHGTPLRQLVREDPVVVVYPAFLLGLPLVLLSPAYLLLLAVPAWRARRRRPAVVVLDHVVFGAGALLEALR
jgi:GT2 family glycosyltransferase